MLYKRYRKVPFGQHLPFHSMRPRRKEVRMEATEVRLLSRKQVATMFGTCPSTIDNWTKRGRFPQPIKCGPNLLRWTLQDISHWLECNKRDTPGNAK